MSNLPHIQNLPSLVVTAVLPVLIERCAVMAKDHVQHVESLPYNVFPSLCSLPEPGVLQDLGIPAPC